MLELKDATTSLDKRQNRHSHQTPVEQAFSYQHKYGNNCGWVIVSNFIETRLYKSGDSQFYEKFNLYDLCKEQEFIRFHFLLCKDNLISMDGTSIIENIYKKSEDSSKDISRDFYEKYKKLRNELFKEIKSYNTDKDDLFLFEKVQKLIDRMIFIFFCEDYHLLPDNLFQEKIIDRSKNDFLTKDNLIWFYLRELFKAIDKGKPSVINRYNGGLFKQDDDLDNLIIPDVVLEKFMVLAEYDFKSDINVNILGQIFEKNVTDIEQIKNSLNGISDNTNKRRYEGIYYTPHYVTKYIVMNTLKVYLDNIKEQLKVDLFQKGKINICVENPKSHKKIKHNFSHWVDTIENPQINEDKTLALCIEKLHLKYWSSYIDILRKIKICDPACGSGAFLNQCHDVLQDEFRYALSMKKSFSDSQLLLFDVDDNILQNNLYGVDINPESVEITKLSLWLKTAKKDHPLTSLDNNIKCGNSIIDNIDFDSMAFDWKNEFPEVFENGGFDIIIGNPPYGAKLNEIQIRLFLN